MSAPQLDLSVIVLSYNTRDLTLACVRALPAATAGLASETLVVDNASSDDTLASLMAEFPAVRSIHNAQNVGFARGNNVGLAAASGRYLLLLNSDTQPEPRSLQALVAFMDTHPEAGACGPQLLNADGSLQPSGRALPSVWSVFVGMTKLYRLWQRDFYTQRGRDYTRTARVPELSGAALLVRRDVYERVGGLDPRFFAYYEDSDWCNRIGAAGWALYYVPHARVRHHWRGSSQGVRELSYRAGQDSLRYYFSKHHGWWAQIVITLLLVGKEAALVLASAARGDRAGLRFHRAMWARAWGPLPGAPG